MSGLRLSANGLDKGPAGMPHLLLYCDVEWMDALDMPHSDYDECVAKSNVAREKRALAPEGVVPEDGVANFSFQLFQHARPHVWFVVLSDCARLTERGDTPGGRWKLTGKGGASDLAVPAGKISRHAVSVDFRQSDGSHLPCDELGLPTLYLLCMVGMLGYAVFFFTQLQRHQATTGSIHPVTACIGIVLLLQFSSMLFEQLHLWSLESSGTGSGFCNGVSHLLSWLATSIMTAMLVLIAHGWTITNGSLREMAWTGAGGGLLAVYAVKLMLLTASSLGLLDSVDHAIYHKYENTGAFCVAMLQLVVWALFMAGLSRTAAAKSDENLRSFLSTLRIFGSAFILAVPAVVTFASLVIAPYVRHRFVTIGIILVQLAGTTGFAQLCFTRSAYFKLSTLSANLLPGSS